MSEMLETAMDECAVLRISLIKRCKSTEDALAIATAFALEAKTIWLEFGGHRHVAAQFYHLADTFAVKE